MHKRLWNRRFFGVLTAGSLFLFGGCTLDGLWNRAQIGFGERLGALSFDVLLGLVFLVVKYFEYSAKIHHHLYPSTNTFLAIYFTLTGLHGLHVLAGMVVNFYLWWPGAKLFKTEPEHFTNRVEQSGLFWHFVDLMWIFLFPILYLL